MSLVSHRPYGIEHPYAVSPDQRVPVLPERGRTTTLGVEAGPASAVGGTGISFFRPVPDASAIPRLGG